MPSEVVLDTIDRFGNTCTSGGANVSARALGPGSSACTVTDNDNGTYTIRFTQAAAGECKVMVRVDNQDVPAISLIFKDAKDAPPKHPGTPAKDGAPLDGASRRGSDAVAAGGIGEGGGAKEEGVPALPLGGKSAVSRAASTAAAPMQPAVPVS